MVHEKIVGAFLEFECDNCGRPVRDYASNRRQGKSKHYFCSPKCKGQYARSDQSKSECDAVYYKGHADQVRQRAREYYEEHKKEIIKRKSIKDRELKEEVIAAYGGTCECCGESAIEFLTIDHINNDGAEHRRRVGKGRQMYADIKAQDFPEGRYRVLCFNCNIARGFYGYCPHHPEDYAPSDKTPGTSGAPVGRPRSV